MTDLEALPHPVQRGTRAQPSFRLLCSVLSCDAGFRPELAAAVSDSRVMQSLRELAAAERVTAALHETVSAHFVAHVPKPDRIVLATRHEENRRRNQAIYDAACEVAAAAGARGIEVVVLKGAAWVVENPRSLAAWREMIDVDLLVDPKHFDAMPKLLDGLGYLPASDSDRFRVNFHHRPYWRPGSPFTIEMHRHLGWRHELLGPALVMKDAGRVGPGLLLPAPWCRAFHAILHWQVQDFGLQRGTLPIRDLLEITRFLQDDRVSWSQLMAHARAVDVTRACEAAVASAAALLNAPLPGVVPIGEAGRRHVVRSLTRLESPMSTWLATQTWRIGTLWRCEKVAYRLALDGRGPRVRRAMLAFHRVIRLPYLAGRVLGIAARGCVLWLRVAGMRRRRLSAPRP